jgi:hypothetical protein
MGADLRFPRSAQLYRLRFFQLFLFTNYAHQSGRIWKLLPAFETADVIEPGAAALRPRGVPMGAVKHVSNPPCPGHIVRPRNRGSSAPRINCLSFFRARAEWAFTVPAGMHRISAVSRMERPSISRSWKVLRRVGERRFINCLMCPVSSQFRYSSSGLGPAPAKRSETEYCCSSPTCSSNDTCTRRRRLRNRMRALLNTMAVSQVEICDSPLNWSKCLQAERRAS